MLAPTFRLCAAAAAAVLSAAPAPAGIIASGGDVTVLTAPPPSVRAGADPDNTVARVFAERADVLLAAPLRVDARDPGTYDEAADLPGPVFVPAGTRVDSYFLYSDRTGGPGTQVVYQGFVVFDTDILGVIVTADRQAATDTLLGLSPATTYPDGSAAEFRGLELNPAADAADTFTLAANGRRLNFNFRTGNAIDSIRVVVAAAPPAPAAVPEPMSVGLLAAGGVALAGYARRRRAG